MTTMQTKTITEDASIANELGLIDRADDLREQYRFAATAYGPNRGPVVDLAHDIAAIDAAIAKANRLGA